MYDYSRFDIWPGADVRSPMNGNEARDLPCTTRCSHRQSRCKPNPRKIDGRASTAQPYLHLQSFLFKW